MKKNEPAVKSAYIPLTHTFIHQRNPAGLLVHLQAHWAPCAFIGPVRDTPTIPPVSLCFDRDAPTIPLGSLCQSQTVTLACVMN